MLATLSLSSLQIMDGAGRHPVQIDSAANQANQANNRANGQAGVLFSWWGARGSNPEPMG
jgi:hypothetical protein